MDCSANSLENTYQTSREPTGQNSMDLAVLVRELDGVNWFNLGIQLNVSKPKLNKISQQYSDPMRCLTEMLDIWLDTNPNASWAEIAAALKYSSECELATNLASKYCSRTYSDGRGDGTLTSDPIFSPVPPLIRVKSDVHECLLDLQARYGQLVATLGRLIKDHLSSPFFHQKRKTSDLKRFLAGFFCMECFVMCQTFDEIYAKVLELVDMFRIKALKMILSQHVFQTSPNRRANRCIANYEISLNVFLESTSLQELKQDVDKCLQPSGSQFEILHLVLNEQWLDCTLKALEKLMYEVFHVHKNVLLHFSVSSGSVVVSWEFPAHLTTVIVDLVTAKIDFLFNNGVLSLTVGNEVIFSFTPPTIVSPTKQDSQPFFVENDIDNVSNVESPLQSDEGSLTSSSENLASPVEYVPILEKPVPKPRLRRRELTEVPVPIPRTIRQPLPQIKLHSVDDVESRPYKNVIESGIGPHKYTSDRMGPYRYTGDSGIGPHRYTGESGIGPHRYTGESGIGPHRYTGESGIGLHKYTGESGIRQHRYTHDRMGPYRYTGDSGIGTRQRPFSGEEPTIPVSVFNEFRQMLLEERRIFESHFEQTSHFISYLKEDVHSLKNEVCSLKNEVCSLRNEVLEKQFQIDVLREEVVLQTKGSSTLPSCSTVTGLQTLTWNTSGKRKCPYCIMLYTGYEMVNMVHCNHALCKVCFRDQFTAIINEKTIHYFHCQECSQPIIPFNRPISTRSQIYFAHLSYLVKKYINEDVYQVLLYKLTEYWSYNLQNAKLIWCPNCCEPGLKERLDCFVAKCPNCQTYTCIHCGEEVCDDGHFCKESECLKELYVSTTTDDSKDLENEDQEENVCPICMDSYKEDKMVEMVCCTDSICNDCFRDYFTIKIKETAIQHFTCPICGEPEISYGPLSQEALKYFSSLSGLVERYVEEEVYQLLLKKLAEYTIRNIPNVQLVWCPQCYEPLLKERLDCLKVQCPNFKCRVYMCPQCGQRCEEDEDCQNDSCRNIATLESDKQTMKTIAVFIKITHIVCPNCESSFELDPAGCDHFHCTNCQYDFCRFCKKPFKQGQVSSNCDMKGFHAHHPRNCFYYLRDFPFKRIKKFLKDSHEIFDEVTSDEVEDYYDNESERPFGLEEIEEQPSHCRWGIERTQCQNKPLLGCCGLCKTHYKDYLVTRIKAAELDPVDMMSVEELKQLIEREGLPEQPKGMFELGYFYHQRLKNYIKAQRPLY